MSVMGSDSNDRIDDVLSSMVKMEKMVHQLVGAVSGMESHLNKVVETEELTVMKVVKV